MSDVYTHVFENVALIAGVMGTIGGVFSFFRYGNYKATVKLQNDSIYALEKNNEILAKAIEEAKESHLRATKEIGILEGQVRIYKDLQLEKMAEAMQVISKTNQDISKTNQEILQALKGNVSQTTKDNGGLLVHTDDTASPVAGKGVQ